VSENTVKAFIYEIERMQLALMGIHLPPLDFSPATKEASIASQSMTDIFAGGFNDIAQKFGDALSKFVEEGFKFKTLFSDIWSGIKDTFFNILGEMATKFIKGFLTDLVSNAADAAGKAASSIASTATSAVSGISNVLSGGLATAIGSFAGTFLAGVLGGGPSGHQQQQQINDTKDSRNYLADIRNWLFSAGSGFGGAIWDFAQKFTNEKIDELKGFVARLGDEQLGPRLDRMNNDICGAISSAASDIVSSIDDIQGAQEGAIVNKPTLLRVHAHEAVVPFAKLPMLAAQQKSSQKVEINNAVNINGQIITDRDYVRQRLLDELISALDSGIARNRLQRALGVG